MWFIIIGVIDCGMGIGIIDCKVLWKGGCDICDIKCLEFFICINIVVIFSCKVVSGEYYIYKVYYC